MQIAERGNKGSRWLRVGLFSLLGFLPSIASHAVGVSVSSSGTPSYTIPLSLPPGIAGMAPQLGLSFNGGGVNGPVGYGWSIQGISAITRCPGTVVTDGAIRGVLFAPSDKLCLDGQRLIQVSASNGQVVAASPAANGALNDAVGLGAGATTEFRTEKDSYSRIRAYGYAGGDNSGAAGPAFFKVWTKSGQILEYGASPNADANTNALIPAQGKSVAMVWAVSRINDTLGNYIDFKYVQRDTAWGSGTTSGSPQLGREWNLVEVQYTGHGSQLPTNKVVFDYADRANVTNLPQDRAEAYQQGSKNVSISRLQAVRSYINWSSSPLGVTAQGTTYPTVPTSAGAGAVVTPPATAVKVETFKMIYGVSPITGRSLLSSVLECTGSSENTCLPAPSFNYSSGGDQTFTPNANFNGNSALTAMKMMDASAGNYGVLLGDFNGDGLTDILRWGTTTSNNQLWLSQGNGNFSGPTGTFNLNTRQLFTSDGCLTSTAADFNADGFSDILITANVKNTGGGSCTAATSQLLLGNGDGSFKPPVALTAGGANINLYSIAEIRTSRAVSCIYKIRSSPPSDSSFAAAPSSNAQTCYDNSKSEGLAFHILDVNGDGFLDIITTRNPAYNVTYDSGEPIPTPDKLCTAPAVCTRVYLGGGANFSEFAGTNLVNHSVYGDPSVGGKYAAFIRPATVDLNGDGLTDLVVKTGQWRSDGTGNFFLLPVPTNVVCANPLDFNGDGRLDCIVPNSGAMTSTSTAGQLLQVMQGTALSTVAGFNLTTPSDALWGVNSTTQLQTIGTLIGDFNGDGRSDILRWDETPANNALYLSNGDGTFILSSTFNLKGGNQVLRSSDGKTTFLAGDFTGRGALEILRMKDSPVAGSEGGTNQLYVRGNYFPPDLLTSIKSASGLTTTLTYAPLTNSSAGGIGARYQAGAATTYPKVNVAAPLYVVVTASTVTGITGVLPVSTEYKYQGLRAHLLGRGLLGFEKTSQQSYGPNGGLLTVASNVLQDHPYIGVASVGQTFNGGFGSGALLSRTTNSYCDTTSTSTPGVITAAGYPPAVCSTPSLIQRPYLYQTYEEGWDPDGNALPLVTTTNAFNTSGDPTTIGVKTTGQVAGLSQTFSKTATNSYLTDITNCTDVQTCYWILGRLSQSTVANAVPNSIGSIATSAGNSAHAAATTGNGQTTPPPVNPAVLSAILQILLLD